MGFVLARFQYLDLYGRFCPSVPAENGSTGTPGNCYWVRNFPRCRVGMMLHLATVLPAGFLAVFQFTPIIRHRFCLYHRIAGYVIIVPIICSNAGAIMVANIAIGGDLPTQTFVGFLSIATIVTFGLALYNIKRLQIDQHRAWMLHTWFYIGLIINLRVIQVMVASISSIWPDATRYDVMTCDELEFIYRNATQVYSDFPACRPGYGNFTSDGHVVVKAHLGGEGGPNNAALEVSFAATGFLALILHAIGVEIYLRLTPREGERLRKLSYEVQLKKRMKNPGSAGLVVERIGDADVWRPLEIMESPSHSTADSPGWIENMGIKKGEVYEK
ncbi:MAG: hypothetical protein Q9225_002314 [Loekoesia sp. 1 TL-2023]